MTRLVLLGGAALCAGLRVDKEKKDDKKKEEPALLFVELRGSPLPPEYYLGDKRPKVEVHVDKLDASFKRLSTKMEETDKAYDEARKEFQQIRKEIEEGRAGRTIIAAS